MSTIHLEAVDRQVLKAIGVLTERGEALNLSAIAKASTQSWAVTVDAVNRLRHAGLITAALTLTDEGRAELAR